MHSFKTPFRIASFAAALVSSVAMSGTRVPAVHEVNGLPTNGDQVCPKHVPGALPLAKCEDPCHCVEDRYLTTCATPDFKCVCDVQSEENKSARH
jgi:hypothetical protein